MTDRNGADLRCRNGHRMRRREAMFLLASAMTAARAPRAQQNAMPVIGYLSQRSPTDSASIVAAFRKGLKEQGYVEGQNVTIESRFAEGQSIASRHWRTIWFGMA